MKFRFGGKYSVAKVLHRQRLKFERELARRQFDIRCYERALILNLAQGSLICIRSKDLTMTLFS